MTREPLYILAVLCLLIVVSEWLVRRTFLRHVGTALLVILVTAALANLGLLPTGSTPDLGSVSIRAKRFMLRGANWRA